MTPRQNIRYQTPVSRDEVPQKITPIAKGAYLLFSGATSALIALVSLLLIFALVSLLITGAISGITIPEKLTNWGAAIILLVAYLIVVLPLKALRFKFSPHKSYALYASHPTSPYGDATLWFAFFILFVWFISEHRAELSASIGNFPDWWRNFVDMVGPWFYR